MNREVIAITFRALDSELSYLNKKQSAYTEQKEARTETERRYVSDRDVALSKSPAVLIPLLVVPALVILVVLVLLLSGGMADVVSWIRSYDYGNWIPYAVYFALVMPAFFSLVDSTQRSILVVEFDLLAPLISLPIDFRDIVVSLILSILRASWVMLLIEFPVGVVIFIATGSVLSFIAFAVYIGATVLLFSGVAFYLATLVKLAKYGGSTIVARARRLLSSIILILITLLTLIPRVPQIMNLILPVVGHLVELGRQFWMFYPFVVSETILRLASGFDLIALLLLPLYGVLSYLVFSRLFGKYWVQLQRSQFYGSAISKPIVVPPSAVFHNPISASILKDLRLVSRDPRTAGLALAPLPVYVILVFSLIPTVKAFGNLGIAFAAGAVMFLEAMLVPIAAVNLVAAEGKALWVQSTLPMKKSSLAFTKTLTTLSIFSSYTVPIVVYLSMTYTVYIIPLFLYSFLLAYSMSLWVAGDSLAKVRDVAAVPFKPSFETILKLVLMALLALLPTLLLWYLGSASLKWFFPYLDADYISLWIFPMVGLLLALVTTSSTSSSLAD